MRTIAYFFFFLLTFSGFTFDACELAATTVSTSSKWEAKMASTVALGSMPVAQFSGLNSVFPPSAIAFTNIFFERLSEAVHQFSLNGSALFVLCLSLYTFLILSVRFRRAWMSLAALSSFCLLALCALSINAPSSYVGVFLFLSFLLLIFDLFFFGSRGWMTWIALLPMSWSWWVWFCQGEIAQSLDVSIITTLSLERGVWLLAAWSLSLVLTQVDIKIFKNLVSVFRRNNSAVSVTTKTKTAACNRAQNLI